MIEYSEDRRRGEQPHIQKAIANVRRLPGSCSRCRTRTATHLIDAYHTPRAVCPGCARTWSELSPLERRQARVDFDRRGQR